MKASSNSGGWKNLVLQHVEKLVLGVAVVLVALFLWSAMGVKPIDASKAPEKLVAEAKIQSERIETSNPPPLPPESGLKFESAVAVGLEPIAATAYSHPQSFTPPVQPSIVKRPEPTLFAVENLRATPVIVSVPEIGVPPTYKDEDEEKTKKAVKKAAPRQNPDGAPLPRQRTRRGRGGTGYGGTGYGGTGYGATSQPSYGQTGEQSGYGKTARGRGAGTDMAADSSKTGYGSTGPTRGAPGYGSTGPSKTGYGSTGYGSTGPSSSGYGGTGYGGTGFGGAMGAKPGVVVQNIEAKGVIRPAVVLTGRVPYSKQFDEFQNKFKDAVQPEGYTPERDFPTYNQFKIERQEITASGDGKWVELDLDQAAKEEGRWAVQPDTDHVDTTYMPDNYLAWPLPPTIMRNWGRLASHPSIPFLWMLDETAQRILGVPEVDGEQIRQMRQRNTAIDGGAGGYGAAGYGSTGGYGRTGYGSTGGHSRGGYGSTGYGGTGYGAAGALGAENLTPTAHVPSLLFRFVDTQKIEPGKQYRYRVTLEMANPNFALEPRTLEDASSALKETRFTPPAESPTVIVPHDRRLFALSSKAANRPLVDQTGQVLYHVWDQKMGAEVAKEFDIKLGEIAEFVDTVENWYNPYTGAGEKLENFPFQYHPGAPTKAPMLADITGGEDVPGHRDLDQPTELLFIDADGRMFTSNQMQGVAAKEFYKERYDAEPPPEGDGGLFDAPQDTGPVRTPTNFGGAR
jgi:hypothetical protein